MAQVAPFVREPIFAVQSRFDEFQLMNLLGLPCFLGQNFEPPFKASNCTGVELGWHPYGTQLPSQNTCLMFVMHFAVLVTANG